MSGRELNSSSSVSCFFIHSAPLVALSAFCLSKSSFRSSASPCGQREKISFLPSIPFLSVSIHLTNSDGAASCSLRQPFGVFRCFSPFSPFLVSFFSRPFSFVFRKLFPSLLPPTLIPSHSLLLILFPTAETSSQSCFLPARRCSLRRLNMTFGVYFPEIFQPNLASSLLIQVSQSVRI